MIMARLHSPKPQEIPLVRTTEQPMVPMVQAATWTGMKDEGIARISGMPVRKMRREIVEEVEWYDPNNKALVRTRMPRQQVFLIGVKTD
jgi:hypothetical protein